MPDRFNFKVLGLLTVLLLGGMSIAKGDAPPSFSSFRIQSNNGRYFATISKGLGQQDARWVLTVFELPSDISGEVQRKVWSCAYRYSGYAGAILSDDGKSVVYVETWYFNNQSVIDFYRQGKFIASIKGHEIPFDRSALKKAVTHNLWLLEGGLTYGKSVEIQDDRLILRTIDGSTHFYNLVNGKRLSK